jgi:hypothetical protein
MESHLCDIINILFKVNRNAMSVTYIIVKKSLNESSIRCMIFTYVYNKCLTLIILVNNCMVSYDNLFIINVFESYN